MALIGMVLVAGTLTWPSPGAARSTEDNRRTCLSGKYPALCDMSLLSPDDAAQATASMKRENLRTCLEGRYSALCKHNLLSSEEAEQVRRAEVSYNLALCLEGKYKALCKHELLLPHETQAVITAERRENLKTCLNGNYSALCNRALLSPTEAQQVTAAELAAQEKRNRATTSGQSAPATPRQPITGRSTICDSGHWINSVGDSGRIVILENMEVWEIDAVDRIDTMLWLPVTNITVCDGQLINTDDGEVVGARLLSR